MIINEVPSWLPTVNLITRTVALILLTVYVVVRERHGSGRSSLVVLEFSFGIACVVLVAGAAFQANLISLGDWTLLGSFGSVLLCVGLALAIALIGRSGEDEAR